MAEIPTEIDKLVLMCKTSAWSSALARWKRRTRCLKATIKVSLSLSQVLRTLIFYFHTYIIIYYICITNYLGLPAFLGKTKVSLKGERQSMFWFGFFYCSCVKPLTKLPAWKFYNFKHPSTRIPLNTASLYTGFSIAIPKKTPLIYNSQTAKWCKASDLQSF